MLQKKVVLIGTREEIKSHFRGIVTENKDYLMGSSFDPLLYIDQIRMSPNVCLAGGKQKGIFSAVPYMKPVGNQYSTHDHTEIEYQLNLQPVLILEEAATDIIHEVVDLNVNPITEMEV